MAELVTDLLQRKAEATDKAVSYQPTGEEGEYLAELRSKWIRSSWYQQSSHRYFNDKNLIAYMNRANDDSFLYVPTTPKDNWHSKTRRQTPREKFNAVISAILDQDLSPEVFAFDHRGKDSRKGADIAQSLIVHSDYLEDAQEKRKMRAHELLKYGTCAVEVSWLKTVKIVKKMSQEFDPARMEAEWKARTEVDFEGVWTKIIPLNRVLLGDITKYFINEQPYIWKEYVMTYDEAYQMFFDWKNWKHVSPVGSEYDNWNDLTTQVDTEESYTSSDRQFVRMRVYENKWSDEYAIVLNDVLMTPVGLPMPTPDKEYSITWTELEMFDQAFSYGRSFFAVLHNDSVILDFLYNAMIDKHRQGMEPPIITSFKNLVNKNMYAPGKVTQGDINFKRAIDHNGVTTADIEIARFVEENIDKSSVSPVAQGQASPGATTAFEIREQQKNALKMLGLVLYSIARMERDIAEKKLSYILKHYPDIKTARFDAQSKEVIDVGRTFIVRGDMAKASGVGRKEISFGEVPEGGEKAKSLLKAMIEEEDMSAAAGERVKKYVVDPKFLRDLRYVFQIVVNPSQRKSKMADAQESREKYAMYIMNPLINPEWTTRMLLRANDDDEEAALKQEEPQGAPGMAPGAPMQQPMQPGAMQPPQPPQAPGMGPGSQQPQQAAEKKMGAQEQAMLG